jgi:hypothetical protein
MGKGAVTTPTPTSVVESTGDMKRYIRMLLRRGRYHRTERGCMMLFRVMVPELLTQDDQLRAPTVEMLGMIGSRPPLDVLPHRSVRTPQV